ncbi:MAG TPA: NAD(P)/FAD-dependent oxidoreductase [Solirubrobacteraceae bacterium]|nr:NAD(P)/FAD-dependent oxidoreductase [Solirubrobacteraceae bacterium]
MNRSAPARHAVVVGAGVAGLAAGAALARHGWSVRIHERGAELRELGAGISLRENGLQALEALGILDDAVAGGERIVEWQLRDERLRVLSAGALDDHSRFFCVTRPALHRALADAAARAGVEVVLGSTVVDASPAGTILLADGTQARADLVVGADGIGSTVRSAVGIAARVRDLEYLSYRTLLPREPGDPAGSFPGYWSGTRRMAVAGCGPDRVYAFLFCRPDDRSARALPGAPREWTAAFPHLAGVIERIDFAQEWRPIHEVACPRWSSGRVVLVGDAAHAMAPTLGQAACIAMHCGVALAEALAAAPAVDDALARWEAAQRPMVDTTQRYGRAYVRMMTRWPERLLPVRSAVAWSLSHSGPVQRRLSGSAPPLRGA